MVDGLVGRRIEVGAAQLDRGDALVATLDCTGGFYSTQHWRGVLLGRLLDEAGIEPAVEHVRVISRTGYRGASASSTRAACYWPRTWVTSRSAIATARRADSWCRAGAASSGSSGSPAWSCTRVPTREPSLRPSGAA